MFKNFLASKHLWLFLGGAAAMKFASGKTFRKLAVRGVAEGMKVMKAVQSEMQSIKEDAEDLCYDEECGCGCCSHEEEEA